MHCFHENVVIQQVVCRGNRDAITKCNSDISENQLLDINEDYTWDFSIRIPYEYEGDLHGCSFIIEYTLFIYCISFYCRNKTHCSYQLDIPVLHLQKPPIVYSVELESSLVKGTPSNGSITIHNQSTSIQHIQFVLNKGFTKWVINGVMDCDYTVSFISISLLDLSWRCCSSSVYTDSNSSRKSGLFFSFSLYFQFRYSDRRFFPSKTCLRQRQ